LFWVNHAVLFGLTRAVLDASLPYLALDPTDIPTILAGGTICSVIGKLSCGPCCASLGAKKISILALTAVGAILMGTASGAVSLLVGYSAARLLQTCSWPSVAMVIGAKFPADEQGKAWGIMATSGRVSLIGANAIIAVTGVDLASGAVIAVAAVVFVAWALMLSMAYNEKPADVGSKEVSAAAMPRERAGSQAVQLQNAVGNPIVWCAAVAQGLATPMLEFQGQVSLMLAADTMLGSRGVSFGAICWHLGVLLSCMTFGTVLDKLSTMRQRGQLIASMSFLNAVLFYAAHVGGTSAPGDIFAGWMKMPLIFLMGLTVAPASSLVAGTTVSRHVKPLASPTVNGAIDSVGYAGYLMLLKISLLVGGASSGVGLPPALLKVTAAFGAANGLCVTLLYFLEGQHEYMKEN
jgi:sugar phosphate permease